MTRTIINSLLRITSVFLLITAAFSSEIWAQDQPTANALYVCTPCNGECDTLSFTEGGVCNHCNMPLILEKDIVKKRSIAFYLQDGVEILDFAGPMEVFAYAGYEVFTVSKDKDPIITQGILKVMPDYSITNAPAADILAFFGGNAGVAYKDPEVINWVKSQEDIEYYFSVCTGAFILAEAGLLEGKSATTFHDALDNFESNYPEIDVLKDIRFVDNGTIITTAGISAGIDGALHLVAKLNGFDMARKTAYFMEYDKWIPGEGLLLSEDNPYKGLMNVEKLKAYVGTYEYLDNSKVVIAINEREQSLIAIMGEKKYPLFYHGSDTIVALNGEEVLFQRNENQTVIGFKSSKYVDTLFHKLD